MIKHEETTCDFVKTRGKHVLMHHPSLTSLSVKPNIISKYSMADFPLLAAEGNPCWSSVKGPPPVDTNTKICCSIENLSAEWKAVYVKWFKKAAKLGPYPGSLRGPTRSPRSLRDGCDTWKWTTLIPWTFKHRLRHFHGLAQSNCGLRKRLASHARRLDWRGLGRSLRRPWRR